MTPVRPLTFVVVLASLTLAGCLSPAIELPAAPPAPDAPLGAPATSAVSAGAELRAIPITGWYTDYPTGIGGSCHSPADCEAVIPFGIHFTGTLQGEAQGIAHGGARSFDPATPTHVAFNKDPVIFSGSVDGCGSGTLSLHIEGYFAADAAVPINETGQLIPGSASSGLAGLVDMFWAFSDGGAGYPQPVAITGTAWCL